MTSIADRPGLRVSRLPNMNRAEVLAVTAAFGYFLWLLAAPFRYHAPLIEFPFDDAFYYLKIAKNLAQGHGSTFNGIVPTNGYHPLWLLVLTGLSLVSTNLTVAVSFMFVAEICATVATFLLSRTLYKRIASNDEYATAVAILCTGLAVHMFSTGMEVILAIPLLLGTLLYVADTDADLSFRRALRLGFLVSLTILSRLDSAILLLLLAGLIAVDPSCRRRITRQSLLGIALGLTPIVAYLLIQRMNFGTWTPISGQAKQLKPFGFAPGLYWSYLRQTKAAFYVLPLAAVALVCSRVVKRKPSVAPLHRAIMVSAIAFPFGYCAVLSCVSDWPLWEWYAYGVPPALLCTCVWIFGNQFAQVRVRPAFRMVLLWSGLLVCVFEGLPSLPEIGDAALKIQQFAAAHPGVFAMGDRSGTVGYLLDQPIVQTEGLVMDRKFLGSIKARRNLRDVLKEYGVRYYISSTVVPPHGVYRAEEPVLGGPNSPKMSADFPERPAEMFEVNGWYTRIYDLKGPMRGDR